MNPFSINFQSFQPKSINVQFKLDRSEKLIMVLAKFHSNQISYFTKNIKPVLFAHFCE